MGRKIHINFNNLIFKLLCCYALLIPLEKILEVLFDVDTVFKPYRVFALLIIATFGLKCFYKWERNVDLKSDLFLYLIFVYGLLISFIKMMTTDFGSSLFYNDIFQIGLYLAIFIIIRHSSFTAQRLTTITKYFAVGVFLNATYIFNSFYIQKNLSREAGLMDNANYMALSIVMVILIAITHRQQISGFITRLLVWGSLLGFAGYILLISGSRTGLIVLFVSAFSVLILSPMKEKRVMIALILAVSALFGLKEASKLIQTDSLITINRITNQKATDDVRFPIWMGVIEASQQTYFVGLGIGQFKAHFREFFYEENNAEIKKMLSRGYFLSPHSDYFALLAIYGIVGLVSYLVFLVLTSKRLLFRFYQSNDVSQKMYLRYAISAFLALIVFGVAAENFMSPMYWLILSTTTKTFST